MSSSLEQKCLASNEKKGKRASEIHHKLTDDKELELSLKVSKYPHNIHFQEHRTL